MVHNFASIIALAVHAISRATAGNECSVEPKCSCFFEAGKRTAQCNAGLTKVPKFPASHQIMKLNLDENKFTTITKQTLADGGVWTILEELTMSRCNISKLEKQPFRGVSVIKRLKLSHNQIENINNDNWDDEEKISPSYFQALQQLEDLDLSYNALSSLSGNPFKKNKQLRILDLSYNKLTSISDTALEDLESLVILRLMGNRFTKLFTSAFQHNRLEQLRIEDNPFHCDCHLRPFRQFIVEKYLSHEPTCLYPISLRNKIWLHTKPVEFFCHVQKFEETERALTRSKKVHIGQTVSFKCGALGDPIPHVKWDLRQGHTNQTHLSIAELNAQRGNRFSVSLQNLSAAQYAYPGNDSTFTIENVQPTDAGEYHCRVSNRFSNEYEVYHLTVLAKDAEKSLDLPPIRGSTQWLAIATAIGIVILIISVSVMVVICFRKRQSRAAPVYTHMNGTNGYKYIGGGPGNNGTSTIPPTLGHGIQGPEKPARTFDQNFSPAWMEPVHVAAIEKQNARHNNGVISAGRHLPIIVADTRAGGPGLAAEFVRSSSLDEVTYYPASLVDGHSLQPQNHGGGGGHDGDSGYLEGATPIPPPGNHPPGPVVVVASTNNCVAMTHARYGGVPVPAPLARAENLVDTSTESNSHSMKPPLRETSL